MLTHQLPHGGLCFYTAEQFIFFRRQHLFNTPRAKIWVSIVTNTPNILCYLSKLFRVNPNFKRQLPVKFERSRQKDALVVSTAASKKRPHTSNGVFEP
jgi:hypothetical protein